MPQEKAAVCRRRSSRISALEEKARLLSLREKTNKGQNGNTTHPSLSTATKKRGRKRKTLVATEEADESEDEREFFQHDSLPAGPSIPEQSILEFILDLLQRRDTQELFAQPVDPSKVEGYYELVKEPMDFGTMRAKLQEGMYTSLEQFERDVFLISSNAMAFNAPTTMFYQEARALRESARKVFHDLHTEPEKFRVECSRTRRRTGKKALVDEAGDSSSKPTRPRDVRNNTHCRRTATTLTVPFLFSRFSTGRHSGSPPQKSIGGGPRDPDRRMAYQHPASASKSDQDDDDKMHFSFNPDALRKLVRMPFHPGAYEDSLNRFSKDLGPLAQRIAQKKLSELRTTRPSEMTEAPGSAHAPWIPMLDGSSPSTLVPRLSQNFITGYGQWGNQFQSRRPEASREAPNFMSVAPIFTDRRSAVNLLPAQYKAGHNQEVPELSADRRSHERTSSGIPNGLTLASDRSGPPSVQMHTRFYWCGEGQPHQNINNFAASNKGKAVSSDDGRNNFSFFSNPVSNAKRGPITGVKGRVSSPDELDSAHGRTNHKENVEQLLGILRGNNRSETTPASQLDSNGYSAPLSSRPQLTPPPTSSSLLASPSEGTWLPFQSENRLDQATRTYLQELRSGNFNAIATSSDAALRYQNERSTRPVPGLMHQSPGRQMQVNEHDQSAVRTTFLLQQPGVAPSQRVPPLNRAGPYEGAASQDCQKQTILSQSFWDMLQPLSLRNNGGHQPGNFDLNL